MGLDGTGVLGVAVGQTDIPMHMGPTHMPRRTSAVGGDQDDWGQSGFAHGDPENTRKHAYPTPADNRITTRVGGTNQFT